MIILGFLTLQLQLIFAVTKKLFVSYEPMNNTTMSLAIGEITSPVEGVGTVKFYFDSDNGRNNITLHNVMYSPKLRNLMSGPALDKNGGTLLWEEREKLRFSIGMDENFYARKINGLYYYHERPHYVCLLNKAIYGLHQSGRE
ncbi:hypothetical protein TNCV_2641071 [Trichonephila clavipes]|nr:hypothetical protein TNCV_2641071 [Trichonephila clavipes]